MTISRIAVGAAATFFASTLSFGSDRSATANATATATANTTATATATANTTATATATDGPVVWPPEGIRSGAGSVPAGVRVDVSPRGDRGALITVTRKGYLVSLRHRSAASAGRDWAAIELRGDAAAAASAAPMDTLIWEATDAERLETTRGFVHVSSGGAGLDARLALAEAPERGAGHVTPLHTCVSHRDGAGGFTVLCKFRREAGSVRAVNVTGARPLEGAWIMEPARKGGDVVARLDLPLAPGSAEARAIGYAHGLTGFVLRAEAVWPAGEAPTLLLDESRRAQPAPAFGLAGPRR